MILNINNIIPFNTYDLNIYNFNNTTNTTTNITNSDFNSNIIDQHIIRYINNYYNNLLIEKDILEPTIYEVINYLIKDINLIESYKTNENLKLILNWALDIIKTNNIKIVNNIKFNIGFLHYFNEFIIN